ncbi:hypothetical protein [Angustibacter luteus]|uniref:DUF3552 domain-containing protein n=1 Tax=Angustibacter luteus TaxID=658456 RepID=A0ABW1JID3_9ACTN
MTQNIVTLAIGLATVLASVLGARVARKSTVEVAKVGVEQGAFLRAEGIYKNAIERLEKERAEDRQRIADLEDEVRKLKARLKQSGIDVSDIEV